jgi:hypothetical protein
MHAQLAQASVPKRKRSPQLKAKLAKAQLEVPAAQPGAAAAAALAIGCLSSGVASAGPVCDAVTCTWAGSYTYIGTMNATLGDFSQFTRNVVSLRPPAANNTLSDFWIFQIDPVQAGFQVNANFTTFPGGINNFQAILKAVTSAAPICGALSTQCTMGASPTFTDIATSTPPVGGNVSISGVTLNTGWYALAVTGTVTSTGNTYSGQTATQNTVPAPGSLALVGVALLGAAVGMRRQKHA